MKEKKNFNNFALGAAAGFIIPPVAVYLFYAVQGFNMTFQGFLRYIFEYHVAAKVLSVALVANLVVFYLFLHGKRYKSVRGVIAMTFLYAIAAIIYMFVL